MTTGLERAAAGAAGGLVAGGLVALLARRSGPANPLASAAELLGATRPGADGRPEPNVEARLGAIAILDRLVMRVADSDGRAADPDRHAAARDMLCAYVRERAGWMDGKPPTRPAAEIPADVQAALEVVCRQEDGASEVDLTRTDLRGARLVGARLDGAVLARTHLAVSDLGQASLRRATLAGASLEGAIAWSADLREASLWGANLRRTVLAEADLGGANLAHANLEKAVLTNASLDGANLTGARLEGAKLVGAHGLPEELAEAAQPASPESGSDA